ncbi:hypothetical protein [Terrisporobacter glycolicus]|uniref:DUF4878 domain-containing protein n=1 Tax=Terrisporobacter glycolicus ATCC 14880 = DSM 1288 TaxID=1121315 RepID=A0ABZ2EUI0_9FIRM|nr:hypothetical protein [Terrisporobacter glycolicus]
MKKNVLTFLMIMLFLPIMMTGCKTETPTDVVNTYFSSIKKSDSKEAEKLIENTLSDEILNEATSEVSTTNKTSDKSSESNKESKNLDGSLKMYLSKIDAKVVSEKVNEDSATVKVEVKAPNYSNLLLEVMQASMKESLVGKDVKKSDVEKSLEAKIKNSKAETRTGQINLTKKDNKWNIKSDADITNLLLGEADERESVMFSK